MGKVATTFNAIGLALKKHSPELLAVASGVGTLAAVVLACKATTKAGAILEEHKAQVEQIHEVRNNEEFSEEYTDKDYKKDLTLVYSKTIVKLGKLYGPAIFMTAQAIFCLFAAVSILKKRNAALASTCAALLSSFSNYRQRVKDRFGEDVEWEIANDIHEVETTVVETDKNGKEKTKTKKVKIASGTATPFAIVFQEYIKPPVYDEKGNVIDPGVRNPNWTGDREMDMCFITNVERYCNDMLIARGFLTLNQVREQFNLPFISEGQFFGWLYMKNNPIGDNYIDFRLMKDSQNFLDYMNKKNDFVILDMNCDGNIIEYLPSCDGSRKRNNK